MLKEAFLKMSNKTKLFIAILLLVLFAIFVGVYLFVDTAKIPKDFIAARDGAALMAKDIVAIYDESSKNIAEISRLSDESKYEEALNLIAQELNRNREARQKAVALSANLEIMIKNTSQIYPEELARKALEAASVETTLISRLISYNEYLNQLLEILRAKLLGQDRDSQQKIIELIAKINDEVRAVNDANFRFNSLMEEVGK